MHSLEASRGMGLIMEEEGAPIIEAAEREWKRQRFVETRDARVAEQLEIKAGPEVAELAMLSEMVASRFAFAFSPATPAFSEEEIVIDGAFLQLRLQVRPNLRQPC